MDKRSNLKAPSIYAVKETLNPDKFLPVYYLFGEDTFAINNTVKLISKKLEPEIASDFDKETISADQGVNIAQITDLAYAFPFGSGKKLLIVKNFNSIKDKKKLLSYINDPASFTVLIITHPTKITNLTTEPYKTLFSKNYIFEAGKLKPEELADWLVKFVQQKKRKISLDNARAMIDIVGDEKSLLEMQIEKMDYYLPKGEEISLEVIKSLSSYTKEYSIFDLQNAIGRGDKATSLKVGYNLLDKGKEMPYIIVMLTKFVSIAAQSMELSNYSDFDASKKIGISKYYYKNSKNAPFLKHHKRLYQVVNSLYETDLAVKTSSADQKTLFTMLISKIFAPV